MNLTNERNTETLSESIILSFYSLEDSSGNIYFAESIGDNVFGFYLSEGNSHKEEDLESAACYHSFDLECLTVEDIKLALIETVDNFDNKF